MAAAVAVAASAAVAGGGGTGLSRFLLRRETVHITGSTP